ncbi:MAG: hypothetical protein V3R82_02605 [Candidatus Hydrothermarchaeales archaeon]
MDKTIKLLSSITTKALDDGIITEDERALLKALFEDLKEYNFWLQDAFDAGAIRCSEERVVKDLFLKIYENAAKTALDDGVITRDERALLDYLGNSLGIDEDRRTEIQSKLEELGSTG